MCVWWGRGVGGTRRVTATRVPDPSPARGDPQAGSGTGGGRVEVCLQPPWSYQANQKWRHWEAEIAGWGGVRREHGVGETLLNLGVTREEGAKFGWRIPPPGNLSPLSV